MQYVKVYAKPQSFEHQTALESGFVYSNAHGKETWLQTRNTRCVLSEFNKPDPKIKHLTVTHENKWSKLNEIVFKEFGRTFPFQKILLRVGFPINDKLNNNLNCFTSKKDFVITISKILKTNFKNQFEVFHVQSECDHQRYLTNKLNDLERMYSSIDD